ncbi:MAG: hypothetical protein ACKO63_15690 [Nodosilinea sp.]
MTPRSQALPFLSPLPSSCRRFRLGPRLGPELLSRLSLGGAGLGLSVAAHALILGLPLQTAGEKAPLPPIPVDSAAVERVSLRVLPSVPIPPPVISPGPAPPLATPSPAPEPAPAEPQALAPEPLPSPAPVAPPQTDPQEPQPYSDFPHLEGAQASCGDRPDCWQVPVASWRLGAQDLCDRLEAEGYSLSNVTGEVLGVDTGVRVYAVSKGDAHPYYLNLVSSGAGLLYTITEQPISEAEVLALQALESPLDRTSIGTLTPQ